MLIFWKHISPKTSERYFHGITAEEYDEDDVHEYVNQSMAIQGKEAHKKLSITELPKSILQNHGEHHMETNM